MDGTRRRDACHLALAISVHDFRDQVKHALPDGTPVPSAETLHHQFALQNAVFAATSEYGGWFKIRFVVQ